MRRHGLKSQLHKSRDYGINLCEHWLEKQCEIDRLRAEVYLLKAKLNQSVSESGREASPVLLHPLLSNSSRHIANRTNASSRMARSKGHPGQGRSIYSGAEADKFRQVEFRLQCPDCGGQLGARSVRVAVIDIKPVVIKRSATSRSAALARTITKAFRVRCGGVLLKAYGSQLMSELAGAHYL